MGEKVWTRASNSIWLSIAAYELATIATMVILVTIAHAGVRALRMPWIDRHSHAVAGAVIISLGITMAVLGI